jgi:subtilisin family serine protease
MCLKSFNRSGVGYLEDIIPAILYAVNHKAKVINASWGSGKPSQSLKSAIKYAEQNGVLFVASVGNRSLDIEANPQYPASYSLDNIISVGASDSYDQLAYFSNYGGESVDLVAPGVKILSTVGKREYRSLSGTSMAAPYVSGTIGLMFSESRSLLVTEIVEYLLTSVDPIISLQGRVKTGGRLNAYQAWRKISHPSFVQSKEKEKNITPLIYLLLSKERRNDEKQR